MEPKETQNYGEMLDDGWADLGEKAHWWGKQPNQPTCWSRAGAKPSRIDGMMACRKAVGLLKDIDIIKKEEIPTHAIVRIVVSRNAMQEERNFLRTLTSLKKQFEQRMRDLHSKHIEGKEPEDGKAEAKQKRR